jgi:pimeloyl-ACP methyl ester carboxylesterase
MYSFLKGKEERFEMLLRRLLFSLVPLVLLSGFGGKTTILARAASGCVNPMGTTTLHGMLGGANYTIEVPSTWNGTLALYSHGLIPATEPLLNPAPVTADELTRVELLRQGYALAGSSYSRNDWATQQALHDQIALLHFFEQTCGQPARTIAWGTSMGGLITAGLIQLYPERFQGALPMCGVLSGAIGYWNQILDNAFAFNVLLAGATLPLVHIPDPAAAFKQAQTILATAQQTPQGRARIALATAFADVPGWYNPFLPEPASTDFTTQQENQFQWERDFYLINFFAIRADQEALVGGNPSWNTRVNYRQQLERSIDRREVQALYKQAGLSLNADLNTLAQAPRIAADLTAVDHLSHFIIFNGDLDMPVLTLHTIGDGLVANQSESAYASVVRWAGDSQLLRTLFVHRAYHCAFTSAEMLTAFHTLIQRLKTGRWDETTEPALLNQEAAALGPTLNTLAGVALPPAFRAFTPTRFLRPFDVRNL